MIKYNFLFFFSFLLTAMTAQNTTITGTVISNGDGSTLPGAHVILVPVAGGAELDNLTDDKGKFVVNNIKPGEYLLTISYLGFTDYKKQLQITRRGLELGDIKLVESAYELGQVQVVGQAAQAVSKDDTLQFNASSFKTNPDASAEDLTRKVPGIVIENGRIQAQGEDVKEILVDGKPFFGNDPAAALKNLPAEVIDKIQIFDRQSDQDAFSGFNSGQTTKSINIITRQDKRNGAFGRLFGGYGTDERYQAGGAVNRFKDDVRFTILGQFNNINEQNFSSEDLSGVSQGGGRSSRGGSWGGGGWGGGNNDFVVDQKQGIARTNAFGMNYSDTWGKKLKISGSYFFNQGNIVSEQNLNRELINNRSDFSQFYEEHNEATSGNLNHRMNMRIEYEINKNNSLIIQPRMSMQDADGMQLISAENNIQLLKLNDSKTDFSTLLGALNFSNQVLWRHKFKKAGRTFSAEVNNSIRNQDGESSLYALNNSFGTLLRADTIDQENRLLAKGSTASANINFNEPISKKSGLQFSYNVSRQIDDSDKKNFNLDPLTNTYSELNGALSNVLGSEFLTQRAGLGIRGGNEKMQFNLNTNAQWVNQDASQTYPLQANIERNYFNVLPFAYLKYNFSKQKSIRFFGRAYTNAPSISQLQEVVDNSSPLRLRTGNPELLQSLGYNMSLRYSATNPAKSTILYSYISGTINRNQITNSTIIATEDSYLNGGVLFPRGGQLVVPVNLNGNWNLRAFTTYGFPLKMIKSNANLSLNASYQEQPGMVNKQINTSETTTLGFGLSVTSNISEKIDFTLSSRTNWNQAISSLNSSLNSIFLNQQFEGRINLILPGDWTFRSSIINQSFSGLGDGFNQNYWLWNGSIGKKFLKDNKGELSLVVFDLLKQNVSIQRNVTELYIEDAQTIVLQQYFMLRFNYRLSAMAPATNNQQNNDMRPSGMPWSRGN
jgi:hypothetical protein